jgi:uncharacterized membrane protein YphA (DoxX/SURF4 family)
MLHDRDARTLARLRALQNPLLIAGALLFLLGAGYMLWAVDRLHGTPAAAEPDAFDRPIARLARLVGNAQDRLTRVQPVTALETSLLDDLHARTDLTGRLLLLVLRLLVGSVVATAGLTLLATALAQRPLLGIFRRLGI